MRLFIGTYTRTTSEGIYSCELDGTSGRRSEPTVAARTANPTFLACDPAKKYLYAVHGSPGMAVAYNIEPTTGSLMAVGAHPAETGPAPCHLAVDATGQALTLTNYHTGIVAALAIKPGGALGAPQVLTHTGHSVDPTRQAGPHPHSVVYSPDNKHVLACDLGLDKIFSYALTPAGAHLEAGPAYTTTPPGSGPRHSVFSPGGKHYYVVTEISSTVLAYNFDATAAALGWVAQYSALPPGYAGQSTAAEIALHPNGRFLYVSNRGHDSLTVFSRDVSTGKLQYIGSVPSGGKDPRSFAVSADGRWLVCANQNSDNLTAFAIEDEGAKLREVGEPARVPQPVCVLFYD